MMRLTRVTGANVVIFGRIKCPTVDVCDDDDDDDDGGRVWCWCWR